MSVYISRFLDILADRKAKSRMDGFVLFNSKAIDPSFRFKIGYVVQVSSRCGVSHSATQNLILLF